MDECVFCDTIQSQHYSKDHSFESKQSVIDRIEFTLEIRGLMQKMDQYSANHNHVETGSKMPMHNPHYASDSVN